MKDKCQGSGKKPKSLIEEGYGVCPCCPSGRRLRADGCIRAHQWTAQDQACLQQHQAITRELWSLFGRKR